MGMDSTKSAGLLEGRVAMCKRDTLLHGLGLKVFVAVFILAHKLPLWTMDKERLPAGPRGTENNIGSRQRGVTEGEAKGKHHAVMHATGRWGEDYSARWNRNERIGESRRG